ncbi:MAG: hypothetical protein QNK20_10590 [Aureibaculum sp.]|nr:hypothetical protein [Aureibaculum sp.]
MDQNGKGKHKQKFFEKYDTITDKDYKLEMLWSQRIIQGKLHRIRLNITRILWTVAIFIVIGILGIILLFYK